MLRGFLDCCYNAAIFAAPEYERSDVDVPVMVTLPPVIDPLSTKDMAIDAATARTIIEPYGVDASRPFVSHIARFVRWSDPAGVIEAYRLAKRAVPELQLVLVWAMPGATAEMWQHFQSIARRVGQDEDVHLLTNLDEVGNLEVNVFERAARVVLYRALRKGFATAVAEASWKGPPVVEPGRRLRRLAEGRSRCRHAWLGARRAHGVSWWMAWSRWPSDWCSY